jgi:hypothetical protein
MIAAFDNNNVLQTGYDAVYIVASGGAVTLAAYYPLIPEAGDVSYTKYNISGLAASAQEKGGEPDEIFLETAEGLFVLKIPTPVYSSFPMQASDWELLG